RQLQQRPARIAGRLDRNLRCAELRLGVRAGAQSLYAAGGGDVPGARLAQGGRLRGERCVAAAAGHRDVRSCGLRDAGAGQLACDAEMEPFGSTKFCSYGSGGYAKTPNCVRGHIFLSQPRLMCKLLQLPDMESAMSTITMTTFRTTHTTHWDQL